MLYYFAYGSNMDASQMNKRCPGARVVGTAMLNGYRLGFSIFAPHWNGAAADIIPDERSHIYGVLYAITEKELMQLDTYEGAPVHYQRISITVDISGMNISAYAYEVVQKDEKLLPSCEYLELIQKAAERNSFPQAYRAFLNSFECKT